MNGLRELQGDFARGVLSGEVAVADRIRRHGIDAARRLSVYRNNTFLGLTEALRDGFPVLHRLVGSGFFAGMARAFISDQPPRSGCLLEYGDRFPAFVAAYPPASSLRYLPDVARLEQFRQEAFHETDANPMNVSELAAVSKECYGELRFRLHPTARWLESAYPVLHIWEVNQPGFSGDDRVDLDEGGCRLLVFRPCMTVQIHALTPGDHAFLMAIAGDSTITEALRRAVNANPQFDLLGSLQHWIRRGLFIHFSI